MKYMTKGILISLSTAVILGFTGCGDKEPKPSDPDFRCQIDNTLAPEWACGNAMTDGTLTAVGSSPLSKAGQGFSRREAQANGRSNLAQQIETLIKDKVEVFARSTGASADEVVDKVSTQVSKQVAKVTLKGSKQVKYWQHPTNKDIYVLMAVQENSVNEAAKESVRSSFKNDNALWQQFQSKQALESLEKEFPTD